MEKLTLSIKHALNEKNGLPFSMYSCSTTQHIFNVPIIKPMLIVVLSGVKELGENQEISCPSGRFIFLSNNPNIDMRNIPKNNNYSALLIEFEHQDFSFFSEKTRQPKRYVIGEIGSTLEKTLYQFIEWSLFAPPELWPHRRQEILRVLYHLGYTDIHSMSETSSINNKLQLIIQKNMSAELNTAFFSDQLAMSESTIRRRLKLEGTSIQEIKQQVKLGHGLHLIQTTNDSIGYISEQCGYHSQSRFTESFKQLFGLTPTELRKTQMHD